ncbi:sulfatase-like hydrolase/transferase [Marinovum sp.]|uniref:sulfatase-like hydrolase/transferase n=1 Tax=Marinovum sp. TaxID=2024839 RepID=UPI002B266BDE|nr:sulfatase-like hydrolase/transferase [Marinovum sp.]
MKRPENVLVIMSDEHQARALSCLGHPLVKTPNLDRLAARGTLFENAYTPSPICVPARAAFATGQYPHQTGYWDNAIAYDGRVPSWGHVLQQAGVRTASIGKLHYRAENDPTGFDEQIAPMHIHDGVGQVWAAVRNPLPEEKRTGRMLGQIGAGCSSYNDYDYRVCRETIAWLDRAASSEQPWLLFSSFVAPHFPLTVPQKYLDLYKPATMPLSELRCENGYEIHPWMQRRQAFWNHDGLLRDDDERRLAMACYFALCSFVDARIGRILDALEATGQAENTLIIYTSDHGECLGQRNTWGKSVLYGEATRVPLIMAGPGIGAGETCATPVNLIDVAPTLAEHFGQTPPAEWPGTSLLRRLQAPEDRAALVFSEYHAAESPTGAFMVADADWKYHYYVDYPPELFDLAADPDERVNLAGRPEYATQEARMHTALLAICDPVATDRAAKSDQDQLVAAWGGREAALRSGVKGASPVPV